MKKPLIILIIVLVIFTGIYLYNRKEKPNPNELTLFGNIEIRQVDLGFRVEGKIAKMIAEEGDAVKKGELLGYLEDGNYKSTYEKNLADIKAFTANSANAKSQYERHIPLCADGTTSKQQCDTLKNTMESSKAELEASKAALIGNKKNFEDTKLYAPDEGIIMTRIQEPGAVVEPSSPIYTMAKTKPVWVRAYIPETNLANVKYGMEVNVYTDTTNPQTGKKREYKGYVGYISPVAEFTPKTVQTEDLRTDLVYRVRVYIYDIDAFLRQGMPVTIKLNLKENSKENK